MTKAEALAKIRREANYIIRNAQKEAIALYNMEGHVDLIGQLLELTGPEAIFRPDVTFGSFDIYISYAMEEQDSYRNGKVFDMLDWCVNNLDYEYLREVTSDSYKIWIFGNYNPEVSVRLCINHSRSESCRMVETGEFEEIPVRKLVCD